MVYAMPISIRTVAVARGWDWIVESTLLFRKAPAIWILLLGTLFLGSRLLLLVPLLGIGVVLVTPNFVAGLAHGAQALDHGKPLRFGYLVSGFLRNAKPLIMLGGVSLIAQMLILLLMVDIGGEAFSNISTVLSGSNPADEATQQALRDAAPNALMALLVGLGLSTLLMMAMWFSPLLVFFDDLKPLPALQLSFRACARNFLPFLLYGAAALTPLLVLMPLSVAAGQPDLGLWLIAPLLAPSLYVSYKDIFQHAPEPIES